MEYIIDGVRCCSSVYSISTGEKKDFQPSMCADVLKSCISRMSEKEILSLPQATMDTPSDLIVKISNGRVISVSAPAVKVTK